MITPSPQARKKELRNQNVKIITLGYYTSWLLNFECGENFHRETFSGKNFRRMFFPGRGGFPTGGDVFRGFSGKIFHGENFIGIMLQKSEFSGAIRQGHMAKTNFLRGENNKKKKKWGGDKEINFI